jgi:cytochrome P450
MQMRAPLSPSGGINQNVQVAGPKGWPIVGNAIAFRRDTLGFMSRCARQFGDVVPFRIGPWPMLALIDPKRIESVLVSQRDSFSKHRHLWRQVTAMFGSGLLTSDGDLWRSQRRLAAPAFAGPQLRSYGDDIVRLTGEAVAKWRHQEVRDFRSDMMGLTLTIAAKTFFDATIEQDIAKIGDASSNMMREVVSRISRPIHIPDIVPLPGHLRYRRAIRQFDSVVYRMIRERRATGQYGDDLLSRFMVARDEAGQPMSDVQLRDEAVTMLFAGHETTSLAVTWGCYLLGQHPEIHAQATSEVRQVLDGRPATTDDLPALRTIDNVITEAMRLYPPAWAIAREAIEDVEIGGYPVRAGTAIVMPQWVVHRDPRWFESPQAFRPSRWTDEFRKGLPRFAYFPFGGGPRICIGHRFATMEAVLILATVIQRFSLTYQSDRKVTLVPGITLQAKGGVWIEITKQT